MRKIETILVTILMVLGLLLLLCDCQSEAGNQEQSTQEDVISQINPYVIKSDIKSYLTKEEEDSFHQLLDAVFRQDEDIELSSDYDSNLRVLSALMNNPYYYFVDSVNFHQDYKGLHITYRYSLSEQNQIKESFENEFLSIINEEIDPQMNQLDKVLALYHYFASRLEFDYEYEQQLYGLKDEEIINEIGIFEALENNKGVCHTYTFLMEFALAQLDIECLRMSGTLQSNEDVSHMWPVVQIDGAFYHCDLTWDKNDEQKVGLNYFGMTDQERFESGIIVDNMVDESYGEVVCESDVFQVLRGVEDYEFEKNKGSHIITLHYADGSDQRYSTQTKSIAE